MVKIIFSTKLFLFKILTNLNHHKNLPSFSYKPKIKFHMQYEEFRKAGHYLIDFITDYMQQVENRPLFPNTDPSKLYAMFEESIPETTTSLEQLQKVLEEKLIPYCTHVNHPGYMGLITPSPNPAGILADLLASALNQNLGAWSIGPSAVVMERKVIRWLNDLIGYDEKAGL